MFGDLLMSGCCSQVEIGYRDLPWRLPKICGAAGSVEKGWFLWWRNGSDPD